VAGAWVGIFDTGGVQLAVTTTDSQGRFIFNLLRPGVYQLQFAAANHASAPPRNITVPSPTGEYNLEFT
jgi:protocatechuate 3,4-dioxygenase beta subunit